MRPLGHRQLLWIQSIRESGGVVQFQSGLHACAYISKGLRTVPWSIVESLEKRKILIPVYEEIADSRRYLRWILDPEAVPKEERPW